MINGASIVSDRDNNNGINAFLLDGTNDTVGFPYISSMNQTSQLVFLCGYTEKVHRLIII